MSGGLTVEQLARSNPMRGFLTEVLRDEQRLGRIERTADGTWKAAPSFVAEYAAAFSNLGPITSTKRRQS